MDFPFAEHVVACGGTAEDPTDDGLRAPGSHIVRGSRQAERSGVNFRASFGLKVVTKGDERAVKVLGIADSVTDSRVNERSENAQSVFKMVGPIPGNMTSAETLFGLAGWRRKVDSGIVVKEFAGEVPLEVCAKAAQAIAGDCLRIVLLHRRRSAYKVVRNAQVHTEMAGKVVAHAGAQIEDAAITAGAAFELNSRVESWGEALSRLCKRTGGGGSWRLSVIRRAIRKLEKRKNSNTSKCWVNEVVDQIRMPQIAPLWLFKERRRCAHALAIPRTLVIFMLRETECWRLPRL